MKILKLTRRNFIKWSGAAIGLALYPLRAINVKDKVKLINHAAIDDESILFDIIKQIREMKECGVVPELILVNEKGLKRIKEEIHPFSDHHSIDGLPVLLDRSILKDEPKAWVFHSYQGRENEGIKK